MRPDNTLETRTGGTMAWRDNSPGNVSRASSTEIGNFESANGRRAIFDSPEAGAASLYRQFFAPNSKFFNQSIADTMNHYADPQHNDTGAYIADIEQRTGLDRSTILNSMSDQQRADFLNAIRAHENTTPGDSSTSIYNPFGN
jgi:hypothetical protein